MNQAEIEAALQAAFTQCELAFCPLNDRQKQILLQTLVNQGSNSQNLASDNPLDELSRTERQALLDFIEEQTQKNLAWKISLLNDWLNNRDSGAVQFIRDLYGFQWLNRVQPIHLKAYLPSQVNQKETKLKVGDRLEVVNTLWEWVQTNDPNNIEWFPCTVISLSEANNSPVSCIIRFDNGVEFEIQGVYDWNRYYWRLPGA